MMKTGRKQEKFPNSFHVFILHVFLFKIGYTFGGGLRTTR